MASTFDAEIRQWETLEAFTAYLQGVPRPAWCHAITNHNTYRPDETTWRGLASMRALARFYEETNHWSAGPHLFLAADAPDPADRGIFQLTPLTHVGIHAGPCNADHLGIESVGDFNVRLPSPAQYQLLLGVNRAILRAWAIAPDMVKVHRECMPERTCPGKYLPGAQIRRDLMSPPPARYRVGPFGAIARTDYRAGARAAASFAPGTVIECDSFHANEYRHVAGGIGFVADGDLEAL